MKGQTEDLSEESACWERGLCKTPHQCYLDGCEHTNIKMDEQDLVYRLRERARIRRQIPTRKSVEEGKPDRIADLLEEAADKIERLQDLVESAAEDAAGED